ncbi:hypothetical protein ABTM92_19150, partial [Acinetobacter baumannii]
MALGLEIAWTLQDLGGAAHIDVLGERLAMKRRFRCGGVSSGLRDEVTRALETFEQLSKGG